MEICFISKTFLVLSLKCFSFLHFKKWDLKFVREICKKLLFRDVPMIIYLNELSYELGDQNLSIYAY